MGLFSSSGSSSTQHTSSNDQATAEALSLREFLDALDGIVKVISETKINLQGADVLLNLLEVVQEFLKADQFQYATMKNSKSFVKHLYNRPIKKITGLLVSRLFGGTASKEETGTDKEEELENDEPSENKEAPKSYIEKKSEEWVQTNQNILIKSLKDPLIQEQLYKSQILVKLQTAVLNMHEVLHRPHALAFLRAEKTKELIKAKVGKKSLIPPGLTELLLSEDALSHIQLEVEMLYIQTTLAHVVGVVRFEGKPPIESSEPAFNANAILKAMGSLSERNQRFDFMNFMHDMLTHKQSIAIIQEKLQEKGDAELINFFKEHISFVPAVVQFIKDNEKALVGIAGSGENKKLLINALGKIMGQPISAAQANSIKSADYVLFSAAIHVVILQRILHEKFFPLIKAKMSVDEKLEAFKKLNAWVSQDYSKVYVPFIISNESLKKMLGELFSTEGNKSLKNTLTSFYEDGNPVLDEHKMPVLSEAKKLFLNLEDCPPSIPAVILEFVSENYTSKIQEVQGVDQQFEVHNKFVGTLEKERVKLHDIFDGFVVNPQEIDQVLDRSLNINKNLEKYILTYVKGIFTREFKGLTEGAGYPLFKKLAFRRMEKLSGSILSKDCYKFNVDLYIKNVFVDMMMTHLTNVDMGNAVNELQEAKLELDRIGEHLNVDQTYYSQQFRSIMREKLKSYNGLVMKGDAEKARKHKKVLRDIAKIIDIAPELLEKDFDDVLRKEIDVAIEYSVKALCHVESSDNVEAYNSFIKNAVQSTSHLEAMLGVEGYISGKIPVFIKSQIKAELSNFIFLKLADSTFTGDDKGKKKELCSEIKIKFDTLFEAYRLMAKENKIDESDVRALLESEFLDQIRISIHTFFIKNFSEKATHLRLSDSDHDVLVKSFFGQLSSLKADYYIICDIFGVKHERLDDIFSEATDMSLQMVFRIWIDNGLFKKFANAPAKVDSESEEKLYHLILKLAGSEQTPDTYDPQKNPQVLIGFFKSQFKTLLSAMLKDDKFTMQYLLGHPEHFLHFVKMEWNKELASNQYGAKDLAKELASVNSSEENIRKSELCEAFQNEYKVRTKSIVDQSIGYTQERCDTLRNEKSEKILTELFSKFVERDLIHAYVSDVGNDVKELACMKTKSKLRKMEADHFQMAEALGVGVERVKKLHATVKLQSISNFLYYSVNKRLLNVGALRSRSAQAKIENIESIKGQIQSYRLDAKNIAAALCVEGFNADEYFNERIEAKINYLSAAFIVQQLPLLLAPEQESFSDQFQAKFIYDLQGFLEETRQYASIIGMSDDVFKSRVHEFILKNEKAKELFEEDALKDIIDSCMAKVVEQYIPTQKQQLSNIRIEIATKKLEETGRHLEQTVKALIDEIGAVNESQVTNDSKGSLQDTARLLKRKREAIELASEGYEENEILADARSKLKNFEDEIQSIVKSDIDPAQVEATRLVRLNESMVKEKGEKSRELTEEAANSKILNQNLRSRDEQAYDAAIRSAKYWAIPKRFVGFFVSIAAICLLVFIPSLWRMRKEAVDANVGVSSLFHIFERMGTFGWRKNNTVLAKIQARASFFRTAVYNEKTEKHKTLENESVDLEHRHLSTVQALRENEKIILIAQQRVRSLEAECAMVKQDLFRRKVVVDTIQNLRDVEIVVLQKMLEGLDSSLDDPITHVVAVAPTGLSDQTGSSSTTKVQRWASSVSFRRSKAASIANIAGGSANIVSAGSSSSSSSTSKSIVNGDAMNSATSPAITPAVAKKKGWKKLFN